MKTHFTYAILILNFIIHNASSIKAQNLQWTKSFGSKNSDFGIAMASDAKGNVYTTGSFDGLTDFDPGPGSFPLNVNGNTDIFIHKMDAEGNLLWVKTYGSDRAEGGYAISVDEAETFISQGIIQEPSTSTHLLLNLNFQNLVMAICLF
jgi:hypothetical protein